MSGLSNRVEIGQRTVGRYGETLTGEGHDPDRFRQIALVASVEVDLRVRGSGWGFSPGEKTRTETGLADLSGGK